MSVKEILISAGEASGDMYAARLARAIQQRTGAHLFGLGGPLMRAAGVELIADYSEVSVMGLSEVLHKLPAALKILHRLQREAVRRKPALVILVDAPGMNFPLARRLDPRGFRLLYFISPQVWAWRSGRVKAIRRMVDLMLCIFPFEEDFYQRAGVPVKFVGHPLVDTVAPSESRAQFAARHHLDPQRPIVAVLPGSRKIEVAHNFPAIAEACASLARDLPVQLVLAAAPALQDDALLRSAGPLTPALLAALAKAGALAETPASKRSAASPAISLTVVRSETYNALAAADCAIVSSGTATVEAALLGTPMVVVYRVSALTALLARTLVHTPFFAMVNLIMGRRVVPELIQHDFTAAALESEVRALLASAEAREKMRRDLEEVRARLGPGGAIDRAAAAIAHLIE
jgi:lipid-A-disaccharide synthase